MNDDSLGPSSDSDAFLKEIARAPDADAPLPEPDLTGKKLGKYEVGARLGEGGMGVVYEATDTVLMRKVAIKVLSRKLLRDERGRARLLHEARSLAAVNHAGIAGIYEVAEADGHVFIAMERVQGQTLRAALAQQGKFTPAEARRIVLEMCRALAHAHQAGVVHRDLKPENVMLTPGGEVKILDFGLAKARAPDSGSGSGGQLTSTVDGHVVGTPSYMSPEQARGQKVDERSDLFALGAIFHELLCGQRAFQGASVVEVLAAVDRDPPRPPLRQVTPEVSVELERTVLRCLEKSPEARFASATEVVAALESKTALRAPRATGPGRSIGLLLAAAAVVGGGIFALRPRPNPLLPPDAKVACPQLEASGVPEPTGWLGAAVADQACSRISVARWTEDKYPVHFPASLLDYPSGPSEASAEDPFNGSDDRGRAVANARLRGAAWLDGKVALADNVFKVHLELKTPNDRVLARGDGEHRVLIEAVRLAMEPLWGPEGIPFPEKLPPVQAAIRGSANPRVALAAIDFDHAAMNLSLVEEAAARNEPYLDELGTRGQIQEVLRARLRGEALPKFEVPLDRSSPEAFALSASNSVDLGNILDAKAVADELAAMVKPETPRLVRRFCAEVEARLRIAAGQPEQAQSVVLAALAEHGYTDGWYPLLMSLQGRAGFASAVRAFVAWNPMIGDAWNALGITVKDLSDPRRFVFLERATLLAPEAVLYAVNLATICLFAGRLDTARQLGARLLASPRAPIKVAGEAVLLHVDAGEARFRAGLERSRRVLSTKASFGAIEVGDEPLVRLGHEMAYVLGESEAFADFIYTRFVQPEPARLDRGPWGVTVAAVACAYGAPEVARPCLARIEALVASGFFRDLAPMQLSEIEGAGHFARGEWVKAAAAFRKGAMGSTVPQGIIADAFDKAGDPNTASEVDKRLISLPGMFNGATLGHVREARRAALRRDFPQARRLAEQVVKSWTVADTAVPAVAEMRKLLEALPGNP